MKSLFSFLFLNPILPVISPALLSRVTFKKVVKPKFSPKIDFIWVSLFYSCGVIRDFCGSADTKKKYVIQFWGQPSLGRKEQPGGETPYKIISLIEFTESSLELKDTTNIFFLLTRAVSIWPIIRLWKVDMSPLQSKVLRSWDWKEA